MSNTYPRCRVTALRQPFRDESMKVHILTYIVRLIAFIVCELHQTIGALEIDERDR